MPRFPERDEGEREGPYVKYPWDGVSGVSRTTSPRRRRRSGCINEKPHLAAELRSALRRSAERSFAAK